MSRFVLFVLLLCVQGLVFADTPPVDVSLALSTQDAIDHLVNQDNIFLILASFFGFGLLLSITPCLFPMIPILSGIIVGDGNHSSTRGFLLSLTYVVSGALTYALFGILATIFGDNLQLSSQEDSVMIVLGVLFIVLALSMFGFYRIKVPDFLQDKLKAANQKFKGGSFVAVAILGVMSSLIVSPCCAAPFSAALMFVAQTGNVWLGGVALFVLGVGQGVPLIICGASAGSLLPKAGAWMKTVEAVFGVIMLAMAVYVLTPVIPENVAMWLWAMLLIFPAIYLRALDTLPEEVSGWRRLWKGLGILMLTYGIALVIGVSMGNTDPLKPLHNINFASSNMTSADLGFISVYSVDDIQDELEQASFKDKPVMLVVHADWCDGCQNMKEHTFSHPEVQRALRNFVVLSLDVTADTKVNRAIFSKFNLRGPATVLFFDEKQQELTNKRVIGFVKANNFLQTLQQIRPQETAAPSRGGACPNC